MRRTRFGAIVLLLSGLALLPLAAADNVLADQTPVPADYCRTGVQHTPTEVGTAYAIPPGGRELRGTFPPPAGGQTGGVDFGVLNLEGQMVVAFQGIVVHPTHENVRRYFGFARPDAATMTTLSTFFERMNECASSADVSAFLSDFGYAWLCFPDDLFQLDETGLTSICPDSNSGASVQRVESLLDAFVLEDGRLLCVTSLERPSTPAPTTGTMTLDSIIRVISRRGESLLVNAAIGGIDWETSASTPVPIAPLGSTPIAK